MSLPTAVILNVYRYVDGSGAKNRSSQPETSLHSVISSIHKFIYDNEICKDFVHIFTNCFGKFLFL
jgi:hypothetical protein